MRVACKRCLHPTALNDQLHGGHRWTSLRLLALLEAKPGKEKEVEEFLKSAQPLAVQEPGTTTWYAVKLGPDKFGIFDTSRMRTEADAHLTGEIAKALFAKAEELFAAAPQVEKLEILASKAPERMIRRAAASWSVIRPTKHERSQRGGCFCAFGLRCRTLLRRWRLRWLCGCAAGA